MSLPRKIDAKGYKITADDKIDLENFNKHVNYYKQEDEDEYHIVVVDHARLLTVEKEFDDRRNIENFSSSYLMAMRDRWNFIPVMVQQQMAAQESTDNVRADKIRPSADGLGISKNTAQDVDTLIGLFSPARHRKLSWEGYDISRLKDKHRELSIVQNRRGNAVITQLYFNGACGFFKELPPVDIISNEVYEKILKDAVNPQISY